MTIAFELPKERRAMRHGLAAFARAEVLPRVGQCHPFQTCP
jgi:hypothetical protein